MQKMLNEADIPGLGLILFDDYGTLTNTPFLDHEELRMLPNRAEMISALREWHFLTTGYPLLIGLVANRGGWVFGMHTKEQAEAEIAFISQFINADYYRICYAHPKAPASFEEYRTEEALTQRKPNPGMLLSIIEEAKVPKARSIMVGNDYEDSSAAYKAGIRYFGQAVFFSEVFSEQIQAALIKKERERRDR